MASPTSLGLSVPQGLRDKVEYAANLEGKSLALFVADALESAADRIIEHGQTITLSDRDRDRFLELLDNPPGPNGALVAAARRYGEAQGLG